MHSFFMGIGMGEKRRGERGREGKRGGGGEGGERGREERGGGGGGGGGGAGEGLMYLKEVCKVFHADEMCILG